MKHKNLAACLLEIAMRTRYVGRRSLIFVICITSRLDEAPWDDSENTILLCCSCYWHLTPLCKILEKINEALIGKITAMKRVSCVPSFFFFIFSFMCVSSGLNNDGDSYHEVWIWWILKLSIIDIAATSFYSWRFCASAARPTRNCPLSILPDRDSQLHLHFSPSALHLLSLSFAIIFFPLLLFFFSSIDRPRIFMQIFIFLSVISSFPFSKFVLNRRHAHKRDDF